jgi:hypothetical protein
MSALSDKVVTLSITYLGPAAKVFLERQTKAHMNGLAFDALDRQHLPELSKWIFISGKLIIDPAKAKELADKIAKL